MFAIIPALKHKIHLKTPIISMVQEPSWFSHKKILANGIKGYN